MMGGSMGARIVVGFLTRIGPAATGASDAHTQRVTDLCRKAEALGGRLCAFGSRSVAFEFPEDELEEAICLALGAREEADEPQGSAPRAPWRMGIAEGDMFPVAEAGTLATLSWGRPLVTAVALARIAHPGELLVDPELRAVVRGEVATSAERVGKDAGRSIRGLVVDPRRAPREGAATANVTGLARPSLVGHHAALRQLLSTKGPLGLVRAERGFGGTRLLLELEEALFPARSLYFCSAGAEPLGALRRAFARSIAMSGFPPTHSLDAAAQRGLERILAGDGLDVRRGAELVVRWIRMMVIDGEHRRGAVLVDDAMEIDDPSLDVVAAAAQIEPGVLKIVARLDASAAVPPPLQPLVEGPTVILGPLPRSCAEELAASAAQGSLGSEAVRSWARRGRFVPLGIVEALADGIASGQLSGPESAETARKKVASPAQLGPRDWVLRRLERLAPAAKQVLRAVAVLGIEVETPLVHELSASMAPGNPRPEIVALCRDGWLSPKPEGFCVVPSRTHKEVIVEEIPEKERAAWHAAASTVVERMGGKLASAEAARHASLAGDHERAVDLALVAASASRELGLEAATEALLGFAGASLEDIASPPPSTGDVPLTTWIDGLRAGDRDGVASRLRAIASLAKGVTLDALTSLREEAETAETAPAAARARASLAYAIALAVAGRHTDALFAALDALARAREGGEPQGAIACARFLAKLSMAAGDGETSTEWQRVAAEST
jgi:hypothetical protein